jgi:hypothetical protein
LKEYLDKQTEYNMHDGLSIQLHQYMLQKLGVDLDGIDTDVSNDLLEICDDVIDLMYSQLDVRVEEEIEPRIKKPEVKSADSSPK